MKKLFKQLSLLIGLAAFFVFPSSARADDTALGVFYAALKISQVQATRATADYYDALGFGAEAQRTTGLENQLDSGNLGGNEGIDAFSASTGHLVVLIDDLRARGAIPTQLQLERAKAAEAKLDSANAALAIAVVAGTVAALDGGNLLEKIAKGALLAAAAAKMTEPLGEARRAARAYNNLTLSGEPGFLAVSSQLQPAFKDL